RATARSPSRITETSTSLNPECVARSIASDRARSVVPVTPRASSTAIVAARIATLRPCSHSPPWMMPSVANRTTGQIRTTWIDSAAPRSDRLRSLDITRSLGHVARDVARDRRDHDPGDQHRPGEQDRVLGRLTQPALGPARGTAWPDDRADQGLQATACLVQRVLLRQPPADRAPMDLRLVTCRTDRRGRRRRPDG